MLYSSAQHAREWITPEMTRRLMHHVLDGYSADPAIRTLLDSTELWFVPVANPDGYDYTFEHRPAVAQEPARQRRRRRDHRRDGVDPNRNFPTQWGYDNEGSSLVPGQRDLPRHRAGAPSRRPRPSTG